MADKPLRKSVRQFIASCEAGEIGESYIRGMRRSLNNASRPSTRNPLSREEFEAVYRAVETYRPRVSAEQMEKGRAWLLQTNVRKDGALRKNSALALSHVAVLSAATEARLVDFVDAGTRYSYYLPAYQYRTRNGETFTYSAGSWQSGIGMEVL